MNAEDQRKELGKWAIEKALIYNTEDGIPPKSKDLGILPTIL